MAQLLQQQERASGEVGPLWLDLPNAEQEAVSRAASYPSHYPKIAGEMIVEGFTVLKGAVDPLLCDAVVKDYQDYLENNRGYANQYVDAKGRHHRLVNFHLSSENAMKIGCHEEIMRVLDYLFGLKAGIYTSLTFEYGTEQPIHRDSPSFHTFPVNYFVGVWCALEDIDPASGPLMYVPGGHRFFCDQHAIYQRVRNEFPKKPDDWVLRNALEAYYAEVIARSEAIGETKKVVLQKGDVAIWHPQLPHGGAPADDPRKTRRSVVFHCAPEILQVYQHDTFFQYKGKWPAFSTLCLWVLSWAELCSGRGHGISIGLVFMEKESWHVVAEREQAVVVNSFSIDRMRYGMDNCRLLDFPFMVVT